MLFQRIPSAYGVISINIFITFVVKVVGMPASPKEITSNVPIIVLEL